MRTVKMPTPLRLTDDRLERTSALMAGIAEDPEGLALDLPTRTAVWRFASARGWRDLERQDQPQPPAPRMGTTESPRPHESAHVPLLGTALHDPYGLDVKESARQERP